MVGIGPGVASDALVLSYGIGGEVGSASAQNVGWTPNGHTGAAAIVTMVCMAMVVMVVVAVMSDGTSSGVLCGKRAFPAASGE